LLNKATNTHILTNVKVTEHRNIYDVNLTSSMLKKTRKLIAERRAQSVSAISYAVYRSTIIL